MSVATLELGPGRFDDQFSSPFQVRPVNRFRKKIFPSQRRCRKADHLPTPVPTPRLPPVATQLVALPTFPPLTLTPTLPLLSLRISWYSPVLPTPFALARYLSLYSFTLVINRCLLFVILVCFVFLYCGPTSLAVRVPNRFLII